MTPSPTAISRDLRFRLSDGICSLERFIRGGILLPALFGFYRLDIVRAMEDIRKEDTLDDDLRRDLMFERVKAVVNAAFAHSRAYRHVYEEQGFHPSQLTSWDRIFEIPQIDRSTLQQFSHDRILTHLTPPVLQRQTSGTMGQPLAISLDRRAYTAQLAARFVRLANLGIRIGDREARFWGRRRTARFSAARDLVLGRRVLETNGRDNDVMRDLVRIVNFRPRYFYGYASMLVRAARIWAHASIERPVLAAIISTAENLEPFQKSDLEEFFRCPVINEYGSSETDIIAFECSSGRLHLETHNVLVESVPNDRGDMHLLVTNLQNHLMPLIRYRIGDCGEIRNGLCDCGRNGPWLINLHGRTDKRFIQLPNGEMKHSVLFAHWAKELRGYTGRLRQFQVSQESLLRFTITLETDADVDKGQIESRIQEWTRRDIHPQAITEVIIGPIPMEGRGKFSYFVGIRGHS